jgi:cyclopropane fatty-acyl-phospholipid synthase-like methyltransferase
VLDVGCGWGSFAIHAAARHGVRVLGITLSEPQARWRASASPPPGSTDQVEIRVADYRELAGRVRFDAIASIGMVEHVGSVQIDDYAARLAALLRPGGRLLNHGIARLRHGDPEAGPFSERYVFPDAAPLHLARVLESFERARLVTAHVEGLARRLHRDAGPLDRATRRSTSSGPASSSARSACASGASTCEPRATAFASASPASTRCSPVVRRPARVRAF